MKDTALYEHLLGLKTPWSVKTVDLSLADQRVVVEVVLRVLVLPMGSLELFLLFDLSLNSR
jgi:hypothetical protein